MENKQKINIKKIIEILLAVAGFSIAAYLAYKKFTQSPVMCSLQGCNTVQNSEYSEVFGIPISVFGMGYYTIMLALLVKGTHKLKSVWLIWGVTYSLYLTYIEAFVLKAYCQWCLMSFAIIIVLGLMHIFAKEKSLEKGETALDNTRG